MTAFRAVYRRLGRKARSAASVFLERLPPSWRPSAWTVATSSGSAFRLAAPFESTLGRRLVAGGEEAVEPETVLTFGDLVRAAASFFDVGANIGFYTMLAECLHPAVEVVAFEPEERVYQLLCASLRLNGWTGVRAERVALSDEVGHAALFVPDGDTNASLNPTFRVPAAEQRCSVTRLGTYCAEHGIAQADLLKVDTKCSEPNVLRGGRQLIGDCKPRIICEVLKGRTEGALTEFFEPLGYHYYHLTGRGAVRRSRIVGDGTYRCLNYLFVPAREG